MVIEEKAASGMYGPWRGNKSKMYEALCTIGATSGPEGKGGAYGFGKAGLIRGSDIRVVVAYTCFRERREDAGVTRRLLGMTYWGQHDYRGEGFTGFARFGKHKRDEVVPFENEEADEQAARLGLKVRDSANRSELGTTFMLIDTTVKAEDLVVAVERSWWPALEETKLQFNVSVHTSSGEVLYPRPCRDPVLRTFVDAYEIVTGVSPAGTGRRGDYDGLGVIGLVSDVDGWSYAEQTGEPDEQGTNHCSLVALMREPRMVVEYYKAQNWGTPPYVRGVFVADQQVNEALRQTEPKGHDKWDWKSEDVSDEYIRVCKKVYQRVRDKVRNYRRALSPPERPAEEIELRLFDRWMKKLLTGVGKSPGPDPAPPRPFSIQTSYHLESVGLYKVKVVGRAEFAFSEHYEGLEDQVKISIRYLFVEDDTKGDRAEVIVIPPTGFTGENGVFEGTLRRNERALFEFATQSYNADWSGRLIAEAGLIGGAEHES